MEGRTLDIDVGVGGSFVVVETEPLRIELTPDQAWRLAALLQSAAFKAAEDRDAKARMKEER